MTKKKILYIITQGEWGGAQRYVYDLTTNLGAEFEIAVAVGEPKGGRELQERLASITHNVERVTRPIRIIQLKHLVRRISPWHDILAVFELARLYKKIKPDVVHLNSSKAGIIGSLAKLLIVNCSLLIIYTVHGWVFNEPLGWLRRTAYFYLEKWTARLKNKIIVLSEREKKQAMNELKIPADKLAVIPHGVASVTHPLTKTEARLELKKITKMDASENSRWAATIANYYPTKGLDVLIEAVAMKKNELGEVKFFLVGDGSEFTNLKSKIINHKLTNIFLTGAIPDAARLLPAFDTFVLPSRKEGLPYVLLEALQAKVPIIATRVGGIPELIEDKKSGLLINPDNVDELAEALVFAAEHPEEMKQFAAHVPTLPSLSEMIEQTISLYRRARP